MDASEAKTIIESDKQARAKQAEGEFLKFVSDLAAKYQCTIRPVILANVDDTGITRYTTIVKFDPQ